MVLVLGAALGPDATEVEVRDDSGGGLVARGIARHRDHGPGVDDPTTWWRSLVAALGQTGEREIAAISISGSHPGLVLLDGAGAVLRPRQPWADDAAREHAIHLGRTLGRDRWAERLGLVPGPATAVTRLAWLRRVDADTFGRIGAVLLPHDWLTYRLTGRLVTDRGGASLTGAWSPRSNDWAAEVLTELAPGRDPRWWDDRLPRVLGAADRADWLDAPVYELLGLRGRPLVGPGTGEPMAVALALRLRPGAVGLSFGSTSAALGGLARPVADASGLVHSHGDATGGHLAVAAAGDGSALLSTIAELLGISHGQLAAWAGASGDAAASDLFIIPDVPGRVGTLLTGLGPRVTREDLGRAAFDGVACAALDAIGRIVAAGGTWAADEPLRVTAPTEDIGELARRLADLSGRPAQPVTGFSAAAAGACIQAAAVLRGVAPSEVAEAWALGGEDRVMPTEDPTGPARRQAHTDERARQMRAINPAR